MKVLGVIPARGGSKGVANKNITQVAGRPLIAYTLEAAKRARSLTRTIVSTDSSVIAKVCRDLGAEVPFLRPAELATDRMPTLPVLQHALKEAEAAGITYEAVLLLQPTAPLRTAEDIDRCVEMLQETGADSVVSIADVGGHHPLRMKKLEGERLVNYIEQDGENMGPRQELPKVYIRNGAVYVTRRPVIVDQNKLVGAHCRGYVMPAERSVNIDSPSDIVLAEYFLLKKNAGEGR